ncbi:UbiH/UbiF/VisC/COQ6 family ubiquinone biosynthesis hydroxylase [Halomonas icarae]|uniref:2-octaprenyl-3-methyl-6-methoxy-1,4-benzoquinol hydroxylase n=1 Tax=Halomonas icarae TaxID=2691040 RepID=A0A7X5ALL4_9GAMM|nr:UbiH/UbiF/VisC/COQ6 family ubiquinone biosynthesis hydroxylase [Halomonas icarae]MDR5902972.1 UbiH/UbiF/VisC/COQ6 family ubiquinone biosynthesis hydroxylase [Halomonas icarae]NAW13547.1 2-octaprenyl-3-methyl-6-methoxy-1,4-benzoquinol hydroxylase [Halomonas icarae]
MSVTGDGVASRSANDRHEVVIVGGGMVGAALAVLLGEAGVEVALVDARPALLDAETVGRGQPARRVSALTPVSQRLLEGVGAWAWMASRRISPYRYMQVWDAEGSGEVNFSADQAGMPVLGHIVENDVTLAALERRLEALPSVRLCLGARVEGLEGGGEGRWIVLADGRRLSAPLVVAADGVRSPLRDMAGIALSERETGHVGLVTTVRVERPHGEVARQTFLPTGPLAFLPLAVEEREHHCSIVWSTSPAEAERLAGLPRDELGEALAAAIGHRLGVVTVLDEATGFPLVQRHAKRYTLPGFALVGDAAHGIHPLAGQGVNLGLMDAAVLAEELLAARRRGMRLGDERTLARYARRRRGDNAGMLALMDGFRLLFGARHPALTLGRNLGMGSVDRLVPLKRLLLQQATGQRGRLPVSCR